MQVDEPIIEYPGKLYPGWFISMFGLKPVRDVPGVILSREDLGRDCAFNRIFSIGHGGKCVISPEIEFQIMFSGHLGKHKIINENPETQRSISGTPCGTPKKEIPAIGSVS